MDAEAYNKIFDPFSVSDDFFHNYFPEFDTIRRACSFHNVYNLKNIHSHTPNCLNVLHLNVRSIINKREDIITLLGQTNTQWHVIAVSETWLNKSLENLYNIPGYNSFFCSRENRIGGGSALYINTDFNATKIQHPIFSTADVVCAELKLSNQPNIIFCQIYRPPSTDRNQFIVELEELLRCLSKKKKIVCIAGDFNFDLFSSHSLDFFNTMCSFGFLPTISKTTRWSDTSATLLDNIFCNNVTTIQSSGVLLYDLTDHFPVFASMKIQNLSQAASEENSLFFNYRHIEDLKRFLSHKLSFLENENDPEVLANAVINTYNEGISLFSHPRSTSRKKAPRNAWITPALLASINHKNNLFEEKIKNPSMENNSKYKEYRNMLTQVLRFAKKKYFLDEFGKHSGNSKETWRTIASLMNRKSQRETITDSLHSENEHVITNDDEIAESFNKYFAEVGQNLKNGISPTNTDPLELINEIPQEGKMNLSGTNEKELTDIIIGLKNVGAGIDKINAKIFKGTFMSILKYILKLFNACLMQAVFPKALKIAVIKPIFKSGDPQLKSNYRPISILPLLSKILEKLIYNRLILHLSLNDIIHENQFGFQKNKGTHLPLLILQDKVTSAFEMGEYAVGIFLDLRKAFDTVDIEILLKKLHKYGIRDHSYKMFHSYLSDRVQCVKIRNSMSGFRDVKIGVPQGSILGPILFLLYINDLPKINPTVTCLSYADDTAIIIRHKDQTEMQNIIDEILTSMSVWFRCNFLSLNVSKTFSQHYSSSPSTFKFNIKLHGEDVLEKEEVKYLGVVIDRNLKFSAHINHVSKVVSRNIGLIGRNRFFIDSHTALLLYNALVLPHLNYCCLIWGINYNARIGKLFILQKRAVRLIDKVYPPISSEPIFKKYNLLKLADIAKSQMLLVIHKFLTSQLPLPFDSMFKLKRAPSHGTRRTDLLDVPFSNRNYRLFTTPCLGPKSWNDMFHDVYKSILDVPRSKLIIKKQIKSSLLNTYR